MRLNSYFALGAFALLTNIGCNGGAAGDDAAASADSTGTACTSEKVVGTSSTVIRDPSDPGHFWVMPDRWTVTEIDTNEPFIDNGEPVTAMYNPDIETALAKSPYLDSDPVTFHIEHGAPDALDAIQSALTASHPDLGRVTLDPLVLTPLADPSVKLADIGSGTLRGTKLTTQDGIHYVITADVNPVGQNALMSFANKKTAILALSASYTYACPGAAAPTKVNLSAGPDIVYGTSQFEVVPSQSIVQNLADVAQTIELLPTNDVNGAPAALTAAGYDTYLADEKALLLPLLAWGNGSVSFDDVKSGADKARARHIAFVQTLLEQANSSQTAEAFLAQVSSDPSHVASVSPAVDVNSGFFAAIWSNLGTIDQATGKPYALPFR